MMQTFLTAFRQITVPLNPAGFQHVWKVQFAQRKLHLQNLWVSLECTLRQLFKECMWASSASINLKLSALSGDILIFCSHRTPSLPLNWRNVALLALLYIHLLDRSLLFVHAHSLSFTSGWLVTFVYTPSLVYFFAVLFDWSWIILFFVCSFRLLLSLEKPFLFALFVPLYFALLGHSLSIAQGIYF